jgi:hypothetical protein
VAGFAASLLVFKRPARNVELQNPPSIVANDEQAVEPTEGDGGEW